MQSMETLWTFKTARFTVTLDWDYEPDPDYSFDETGETARKCRRGEWTNALFRVRVLLDDCDEIGTSYLGNSIYENVADFRKEHVGAAGRWGSYFPDMVREAIAEARKEIASRSPLPAMRQAA